MTASSWESLAVQIPVVLVFSGVIYLIIKMFLSHMSASESRSQVFIEQQRQKNDEAVGDLAVIQKQSMERLTDIVCDKVGVNSDLINRLRLESVSHDAFVRTSFRERFGAAIVADAERSAREAESALRNEVDMQKAEHK